MAPGLSGPIGRRRGGSASARSRSSCRSRSRCAAASIGSWRHDARTPTLTSRRRRRTYSMTSTEAGSSHWASSMASSIGRSRRQLVQDAQDAGCKRALISGRAVALEQQHDFDCPALRLRQSRQDLPDVLDEQVGQAAIQQVDLGARRPARRARDGRAREPAQRLPARRWSCPRRPDPRSAAPPAPSATPPGTRR